VSIESELLQIKGDKEMLIVEDAHEWAKSHPTSDLHKQLEWDDNKAGYEYRLWQIRRLVALHITYENGDRKFVSLVPDRSRSGGGYRDVDDVLRDRMLHEIMLADALRELERVQKQYDRLKQLKPVWREVSKVRRRQTKGKGKGGKRPGAAA
jgi:hypothetical protein